MPTYTYRRPDGTTFDVFQKMSDPALAEDPETGVPVQRVISGGAGLQFKGDGFYITDYAKKSSDKGSDSGDSKTESKSESKADAAPAKTADAKTSTSSNGASKGSSTDD
ncbi:FmdB family zinc ribbon protein [Rubrivirga sp.]|uniref:FmdB family zinc ribbon protein n=1 Tax=Rubrivirga sp. TaxID=1885344 RepID=UPI003B51CC41